jgi:hypothetical protein
LDLEAAIPFIISPAIAAVWFEYWAPSCGELLSGWSLTQGVVSTPVEN